jgi:hypothetical protein
MAAPPARRPLEEILKDINDLTRFVASQEIIAGDAESTEALAALQPMLAQFAPPIPLPPSAPGSGRSTPEAVRGGAGAASQVAAATSGRSTPEDVRGGAGAASQVASAASGGAPPSLIAGAASTISRSGSTSSVESGVASPLAAPALSGGLTQRTIFIPGARGGSSALPGATTPVGNSGIAAGLQPFQRPTTNMFGNPIPPPLPLPPPIGQPATESLLAGGTQLHGISTPPSGPAAGGAGGTPTAVPPPSTATAAAGGGGGTTQTPSSWETFLASGMAMIMPGRQRLAEAAGGGAAATAIPPTGGGGAAATFDITTLVPIADSSTQSPEDLKRAIISAVNKLITEYNNNLRTIRMVYADKYDEIFTKMRVINRSNDTITAIQTTLGNNKRLMRPNKDAFLGIIARIYNENKQIVPETILAASSENMNRIRPEILDKLSKLPYNFWGDYERILYGVEVIRKAILERPPAGARGGARVTHRRRRYRHQTQRR